MIFRSIKWRLQLWHGLILVLVLGGFGYTAFELQRTRELRRVDQELQDRIALLFGPQRRPGRPGGPRGGLPRIMERLEFRNEPERRAEPGEPPPGRTPGAMGDPPRYNELPRESELAFPEEGPFFFGVWDREGRLLRSRGLPQGVAPIRGPQRAGIFQLEDLRQLHQQTPRGETIVVGRSIAVELEEFRRLAVLLVLSGGSILLLGLAGGWVVATRAMRPIDQISKTAQKIATGDLSQRIPHAETESELGRLVSILNSTFARMESSFAEQVRFTTDVSHELRTPVTVIVSQTQMALSRERAPLEYRESLEACQRAAQRMRRLIESLLQLARLDAGQEVLRAEPFDLSDVARDCLSLLTALAIERQIHFESTLAPARLNGDSDKMAQVINNLLSNAIHHTPPQGKVSLECRSQDGFAVLTVTDTGSGIPRDDLPHIFDRFYRADTSRTRDKGGSGLGLAITRAIVHAHGGTIEVASVEGCGATFLVRLPGA